MAGDKTTNNLYVRILGDDKKAQKMLSRFQKSVRKSVRQMKEGFQSLALAIAAVGAALAAPIKVFSSWEYQMAKVQALTNATEEDMKKLSAQSRELGATTVKSASEAAAAQEALALAGLSTNEILALTPAVLNAAVAGELEMAEAANYAASILKNFSLDAEEGVAVIDKLTRSQQISQQTFRESAEAIQIAATGASKYNASINEVMALTSALANLGIKSEKGGTAIRNLYIQLSNAEEKLREFGFQMYDSEGEFIGMIEVIRQFEEATIGMTQAEKDAFYAAAGGTRIQQTLNTLIKTGADEIERLQEEIEGSEGATESFIGYLENTVFVMFKGLISALQEIGIAITETFKDDLKKAIDGITDFLRGVGKWIRENEVLAASILKIGTVVILVLASLKLFTAIIWLVVPAVKALTIALKFLRVAILLLSPLGKLKILIKGIIQAALLLGFTWRWVGKIFANVGSWIISKIKPVYDWITKLIGATKTLLGFGGGRGGENAQINPSNINARPPSNFADNLDLTTPNLTEATSGNTTQTNQSKYDVNLNIDGKKIAGVLIDEFNNQGVAVQSE